MRSPEWRACKNLRKELRSSDRLLLRGTTKIARLRLYKKQRRKGIIRISPQQHTLSIKIRIKRKLIRRKPRNARPPPPLALMIPP